jgi:energy-coupling factor transporter ATP-binding protein EcfA2
MVDNHLEGSKFIVPPGSVGNTLLFEAHYKSAKGEPIIIVGPTGAGKSLFLYLFRKFFEEESKERSLKRPVEWANCAHFGGRHSDPNVARSELFGSEAGVVTGIGKRDGKIAKADGGALILEEIGELALEVQAMLLTFIETGEYSKLGGTKVLKAKVQIIGATNREEELRPDFRYRFYPFYVDPLYIYRMDILFYMYAEFSDLVKSLTHREVLALLCYNWPGNIREIKRVGRLLSRRQIFLQMDGEKNIQESGRLAQAGIPFKMTTSLYEGLRNYRVDVNSLELLLNTYRIGIKSNKPAFPDWKKYEKHLWTNIPKDLDFEDPSVKRGFTYQRYCKERFGINIAQGGIFFPFHRAYIGYLIFCDLFLQEDSLNRNNLDLESCTREEGFIDDPTPNNTRYKDVYQSYFEKLATPIFEYLSKIKLPSGVKIPYESNRRNKFLDILRKKYPLNSFLSSENERQIRAENVKGNFMQIDLTKKYDEVLKDYHEKVIEYAGGNKKKASDLIGVGYQTFISRINRLGLKQ